jgi:glutamine amidotransferase
LELAGRPLGAKIERVRDPDALSRFDKLVLPGQGAFKDCAEALGSELRQALVAELGAGKPYLGICVGLQLLFEESEEAPGVPGLGLLKGKVRRIEREPGLKIPHMGWNQLEPSDRAPAALGPEDSAAWFYFVHSYHAVPSDSAVLAGFVRYGTQRITALVARDNLLATQFHPEKSQSAGLRLLEGFLKG